MATIIGVGEPANDGERQVIAHLRDHAPTSWTVVHNVELPSGRRRFEIDLVVITPHAVYVVDVKGTRGQITVAQSRWYPHGRTPFSSPLPKLRQHARVLKSLFADVNPRLRNLYVGQLLVLCDPQAQLHDPDHRDDHEVCHVAQLIALLGDRARIPASFDTRSGVGQDRSVVATLTGHARPPAGARTFGNWEVVERLTETEDGVIEYRARNHSLPGGPPQVLLRVHPLDPYLPEADRVRQRLQLGNAYSTLGRLPGHPHVVGHRDFFVAEDESRGVLVLDDIPGTSLRLRLVGDEPMTRDEALRILRGAASGLTHAHRHRIMHRALSPDTVLLAPDGRAILIGFDHARGAGPRAATVVNTLPDVVDPAYLAPEGHVDIGALTAASDVYALGVLGFRLLAGELPFENRDDQHRRRSVLPAEPLAAAGVPAELAGWLQSLCAPDPADRPTVSEALRGLDLATRRPQPAPERRPEPGPVAADPDDRDRFRNLEAGTDITPSLKIRRTLGSGSFGVVYLVHNTFARTDQAMKIILADPRDLFDRLHQEYAPLLALPQHPNVVRVHHGDLVPGSAVPYLLFEYVPGSDVHVLAGEALLSPADVRRLGIDAAAGLAHIHAHGVYHCDIKPGNLLWTDAGAKIIDFNVAVSDEYLLADAGSARYLPPDYARHDPDLVDRDCYALGLSLYEALTRGDWPWDERRSAPAGTAPRDPRTYTGLSDLAPEFVTALLTAIEPTRAVRYADAVAFRTALERVRDVRRRPPTPRVDRAAAPSSDGVVDNPFVAHLQTLYSQSSTTNSGTRGLDPHHHVYVSTRLDDQLIPDVLDGRHRLVIITGNAGDGKTAFLETLVRRAREQGATSAAARPNGADFTVGGRAFRTNLDGSQDEGERTNDDVLAEFFGPYTGADSRSWPDRETRLIAINEGRLVDFLRAHAVRFGALAAAVTEGLDGAGGTHDGVTVVNLNARSVIAGEPGESIFDGLVRELTHERFWVGCSGCALADRCYALHNARTLAHPDAGERITERLRTLYTVAHLRGRLHITMRDLRSALAYLLTSGRSCGEIRDLYAGGEPAAILSGFYFQSWIGPDGAQDRLLRLLRESAISDRADPALDRVLDFTGPAAGSSLMTLDGRGDYDQRLLARLFELLPRGGDNDPDLARTHRTYIDAARGRYFFESADGERWRSLLSHRSAAEFLHALSDGPSPDLTRRLVHAINRSEGLADPSKLGDAMALAVRQVRGGSIRSYRLFPLAGFSVEPDRPRGSRYVESAPERLRLRFADPGSPDSAPAEIAIRLDLYELLWRLLRGGRPATADLQGQHLSLTVFKNMLNSVPYQAVLLTVTGHDQHKIERDPDGGLSLRRQGVPAGTPHEVV